MFCAYVLIIYPVFPQACKLIYLYYHLLNSFLLLDNVIQNVTGFVTNPLINSSMLYKCMQNDGSNSKLDFVKFRMTLIEQSISFLAVFSVLWERIQVP